MAITGQPAFTIGTGSHVYQAAYPFGNLPAGETFGSVSHVDADSAQNVYVFQRADPPVLVFASDGSFKTSWGSGHFIDAHGIWITETDEVWLSDRDAHELMKFSTAGELLLRIGNRGQPSIGAPFNHPADVAVGSNGDVFVADGYGNSHVHRFSSAGVLIRSWGARGSGRGEFATPHGICLDGNERVYVCDRENDRVQIFTVEGEYLDEWRDFYHPMDIFIDGDGVIYVTDQVPRLSLLDSDGHLITRGRTPFNPHGLWVDRGGDVYIATTERGVTKLVLTRV